MKHMPVTGGIAFCSKGVVVGTLSVMKKESYERRNLNRGSSSFWTKMYGTTSYQKVIQKDPIN